MNHNEPVQPDLFGEYDKAQEEAERMLQPATCPACGQVEPTAYLLRNNHGADPFEPGICGFPAGEHPIYGDRCVAQDLVMSHIFYAARNNQDAMLARDMERGRELGLDVDAIAAAARQESTQPRLTD